MLAHTGLHEEQEDLGAQPEGQMPVEALPQGCGEHSTALLWKFSSSHTSCGFSFGEEVVRGYKQWFFSSSRLPVFTKCVGALEPSVPPSVLVEGGSKSWGHTCTHHAISSASFIETRLQILQSSQ